MPELMTAEYDSTCMGCGRRVVVGQPIGTHEGLWMHAACARRAANPPEVCTRCWLTKPCECDS